MMFMRGVKLHIHLELDNVSKPHDKPKLIMQVGKGKLLWLEQWMILLFLPLAICLYAKMFWVELKAGTKRPG